MLELANIKQAIQAACIANGYDYSEIENAANSNDLPAWCFDGDYRDAETGKLYDKKHRPRAHVMQNYETGRMVEFPIVYGDEVVSITHGSEADFIAANRRNCFADGFQKYMTATVATLDSDTNTEVLNKLLEYFRNFKQVKHRGLVLYGMQGVGKTHFAAVLANLFLSAKKRVRITNIDAITRDHFNLDVNLRKLAKNTLVIIDDLGAESGTDTAIANTFTVIKYLEGAGVPLIVTTNLTRQQLEQPNQQVKRIIDRVCANAKLLEVKGKNRRRNG